MFHSARLKLTAWYLLIIVIITMLFSFIIYQFISQEVERSLHVQQLRQLRSEIEQGFTPPPFPPPLDPQLLADAKNRIKLMLGGLDFIILLLSGFAGYFLAGKTLRPIQTMVDEQNRFITDASHELNTPLTSLRTSIEVSLRDKELSVEKSRKILESNLEEVENLQILSSDLMQLAQYQKQNGNFSIEKFPLSHVLESAKQKVSFLAEKKHITISVTVPSLQIDADKKSLIELFVILFDNAIKYSPENTSVIVKARKTDHKIKITVSDQGIGIAEKDLPYIFDRFYRADKSRSKNNTQGYGLGLSIAKRLVDFHKGTISAESTTEKGTSFIILLPSKFE